MFEPERIVSQGHVDVLIIGAGLSGIGTACHIARECPEKSLAVLERRDSVGGTWDLFRYPGVRSDSDMYTMGYEFRPWTQPTMLADGPAIRQYIADTAREWRVDERIRYGLKVLGAEWSGESSHWTVTALHESTGETRRYTCGYLIACTGYYSYDAGYLPTFRGEERFRGIRIHPQQWPENLDFAGKKVVVIGSGATAVTLVPAMARTAGHVTMLQRSPSYVISLPAFDRISQFLAWILPRNWVYGLARTRNLLISRGIYVACRRWPQQARRVLLAHVRRLVGPQFDMRHFTPKYMPWDQRLCVVPNADLFEVLREGKASMETDNIEAFTETGIRLESGKHLEADIVITATGLNLQALGGMKLVVDGEVQQLSERMTYKGVLIENMPNLAWIFGYTNATWTLKSDIAARYLCRLFRHMDARGLNVVVPRDNQGCAVDEGILNSLSSGYVQRSRQLMPRQGKRMPWRVLMDYGIDKDMLLQDPVEDDALEFAGSGYSTKPRLQAGQSAVNPAS